MGTGEDYMADHSNASGSNRPRRLNIGDIASRTGLSTATVSRAINGKPRVSEQTRARVMSTLAEVGYVPSGVAAGLRTGQTRLLGLMIGELRDPTALAAMQGALEAATAAHYGVVVYMTRDEREHARLYSDIIGRGWIDGGLILWPTREDAPQVRRIAAGGMPLVLIEPEVEVAGVPSVHSDPYDAGFRCTRHLLELGHRRIAMCAQSEASWNIGGRFLAGYRTALAEAGVAYEPSLGLQVGGSYEAGYDAAVRLLKLPEPPTGLCCNSDLSALGAMAAVRDLGRGVPDDISVVGYDDSQLARLVKPALTTPRDHFLGLARTACELLVALLDGAQAPAEPLLVRTEIAPRQSTTSIQGRGQG